METAANEESAGDLCRRIYRETHDLYGRCRPQMLNPLGYTILYGPPIVGAPVIFVGQNPGGAGEEPLGWGNLCEYGRVPAPWLLAEKMQEIWPVSLLQGSTGLNENFLHSMDNVSWLKTDEAKRMKRKFGLFCRESALSIVKVLKPKTIVTYGAAAYRLLAEGREVGLASPARDLVWFGKFKGDRETKVFGMPHLSGNWTRPDANETADMQRYFAEIPWEA